MLCAVLCVVLWAVMKSRSRAMPRITCGAAGDVVEWLFVATCGLSALQYATVLTFYT